MFWARWYLQHLRDLHYTVRETHTRQNEYTQVHLFFQCHYGKHRTAVLGYPVETNHLSHNKATTAHLKAYSKSTLVGAPNQGIWQWVRTGRMPQLQQSHSAGKLDMGSDLPYSDLPTGMQRFSLTVAIPLDHSTWATGSIHSPSTH